MHDSISELEARLAVTTDKSEKLDLMIEISSMMQHIDPERAFRLASKALRLATLRKDRLRMARSAAVLGYCEFYRSDFPVAIKRFQRSLALSLQTDDVMVKARAYHGIGITHTGTGDFPEAMQALALGRQFAEVGETNPLLGYIHNSIGILYKNLGDYSKALDHYHHGQRIFEELGDRAGLTLITNNLGVVYLSLGDAESAREAFISASELAIMVDDRQTETMSMVNLGIVLERAGRIDEAMRYYLRALDHSREIANLHIESYVLRSIGGVQKERGDFAEAFTFIQQALVIAEATEDAIRWNYRAILGEIHLEQRKFESALDCFHRALEGVRQQGDRDTEFQILFDLSRCHEAMGSLEEAFHYHKLYAKLKEEVVGQERQREMIQIQMRGEIDRSEKEREILRLKNQQLEQEMERKAQELTAMALHLVEKNQFLGTLKRDMADVVQSVDGSARPAVHRLIRQVDGNIKGEEEWKAFEAQFEKVYHGFIGNLVATHPTLSRTELKVCALLKIQMSTKEIATVLSTTVKNIEIHRYRIRKKLKLSPDQKLTHIFAMS